MLISAAVTIQEVLTWLITTPNTTKIKTTDYLTNFYWHMDHKISNTEKHRGNSKFQILQLWCPAVRFFAKVETLAKGPVFSLACGVCAAAQQHYYWLSLLSRKGGRSWATFLRKVCWADFFRLRQVDSFWAYRPVNFHRKNVVNSGAPLLLLLHMSSSEKENHEWRNGKDQHSM